LKSNLLKSTAQCYLCGQPAQELDNPGACCYYHGADGKEGWTWPYQELIWEIPAKRRGGDE